MASSGFVALPLAYQLIRQAQSLPYGCGLCALAGRSCQTPFAGQKETRQTPMLRSRPNHLGDDSTDAFERRPLNCRPDWGMIQVPENPAYESEQNI